MSSKAARVVLSPVIWIGLAAFFNIAAPIDLWPSLAPLETLTLLMGLATCALKAAADPSVLARPAVRLVACAVLAMLMAPIASSLALDRQLDVVSDPSYRHFAKFMLLVVAATVAMDTPRQGRSLATGLLLSLAALAAQGLFRHLWLGQGNLDTGRMELPFRHGDPNFLCVFMAIGLGLAATRMVEAIQARRHLLASGSLALLALFGWTAWLTASRGGLFAILVMGAILIFRLPGRPGTAVRITALLAALVCAVFLDGERLAGRLETLGDQSALGRVDGVLAGLASIREQPVFGLGFNRSSDAMRKAGVYPYFPSEEGILTIHNTPMQVAAELGIVGVAAYAFALLLLLAACFPKQPATEMQRTTLIAIICAVTLAIQTLPMAYNGTLFGILGLLSLTLIVPRTGDAPSPALRASSTVRRREPPSSRQRHVPDLARVGGEGLRT